MVNYLKKVAADLKRQLSLPHPVAANASRRTQSFLREEGRLSGIGKRVKRSSHIQAGKILIK